MPTAGPAFLMTRGRISLLLLRLALPALARAGAEGGDAGALLQTLLAAQAAGAGGNASGGAVAPPWRRPHGSAHLVVARSTHTKNVAELTYSYERVGMGGCDPTDRGSQWCPNNGIPRKYYPSEILSEPDCQNFCNLIDGCSGYQFTSEDGNLECIILFWPFNSSAAPTEYAVTQKCMRRTNYDPSCEPRTSSTMTLTSTAVSGPSTKGSSYGDPHITTLQGEKFDIRRPGTHTYLVVPRGAGDGDCRLRVLAKIVPRGDACGDGIYLVGLQISGSWLQDVGRLDFATLTEEFDTDATMGLKVNGSRVSWAGLADALPQESVEVSRFHPVPHKQLDGHVNTLQVKLRLGTASVTVGFAHTFQPSINWLWTEVAGIAAEEAGGLLAAGDHSWAATRPDECGH